ncbi:MAG: VWA domain-containing protein [Bacillota bacterium]|nr:VWA domain-containing protein [Bacillota bacterium]
MWDDIDAVKASSSTIVSSLDESVQDYRVAVIDYKDFPTWPYGGSSDYTYRAVLPFSTNKTTIISALNSLSASGGADWKESVYSALTRAILTENLGSWRDGVEKIVILMGDAPPHAPEPFTGYTEDSVVATAESVDPAIIYSIVIGNDSETYESFSRLAQRTEGHVFFQPLPPVKWCKRFRMPLGQ